MNNPTYKEFVDESVKILCNAVITGGFNRLRNDFQYIVLQWHFNIMNNGGLKKEKET